MAADVSTSLLRLVNGGDANESGKSTAPITRDLLGGCCTLETKELDLDLQVPCGWEKRLDLKSGKIYLQRSNSTNSSSSISENTKALTTSQDLNFPPTPSKQTLNLFNDPVLDLKLVSTSTYNQSVCTLDKVKYALERTEKESTIMRKRSAISTSKSSPSSSLIKGCDYFDQEVKLGGAFAAGCPSCLLYVLISRNNPKCPRCNCIVPLPALAKKRRIDLNM